MAQSTIPSNPPTASDTTQQGSDVNPPNAALSSDMQDSRDTLIRLMYDLPRDLHPACKSMFEQIVFQKFYQQTPMMQEQLSDQYQTTEMLLSEFQKIQGFKRIYELMQICPGPIILPPWWNKRN